MGELDARIREAVDFNFALSPGVLRSWADLAARLYTRLEQLEAKGLSVAQLVRLLGRKKVIADLQKGRWSDDEMDIPVAVGVCSTCGSCVKISPIDEEGRNNGRTASK